MHVAEEGAQTQIRFMKGFIEKYRRPLYEHSTPSSTFDRRHCPDKFSWILSKRNVFSWKDLWKIVECVSRRITNDGGCEETRLGYFSTTVQFHPVKHCACRERQVAQLFCQSTGSFWRRASEKRTKWPWVTVLFLLVLEWLTIWMITPTMQAWWGAGRSQARSWYSSPFSTSSPAQQCEYINEPVSLWA